MITVVKKNTRLKLTFAIPTGNPTALVKEIIDIASHVADKRIKVLSEELKAGRYLFSFLLIISLS